MSAAEMHAEEAEAAHDAGAEPSPEACGGLSAPRIAPVPPERTKALVERLMRDFMRALADELEARAASEYDAGKFPHDVLREIAAELRETADAFEVAL